METTCTRWWSGSLTANESKTKTVTVTVENVEEAGTVSLSQRTPQQGLPVTASLSDKDGSITGTEWQWYKSDVKIGSDLPAATLAAIRAADSTNDD